MRSPLIFYLCLVFVLLLPFKSALNQTTKAVISGTFFQPWIVSTPTYTSSRWDLELSDLKNASVNDHIIWQWTVDSTPKTRKAYYPTTLANFSKPSNDQVAYSLAAAQKAGIKVWLGLNWNDEWWTYYANNVTWLTNEFNLSQQIALDLWRKYGGTFGNVIEGFYLTMEVDNDNFATILSQTRLASSYKSLCDYIHTNMKKKVMVAPFASDYGRMNQNAYQVCWEKILTAAAIDVINFQDGCGASDDGINTHTTIKTVGGWFAALRNAIKNVRPTTQLWNDLESFSMDAKGNFSPSTEEKIEAQINASKSYVDKISSFAFWHYQAKLRGFVSQYNAYQTFVNRA